MTTSEPTTPLGWALAYLAKGFSVIPANWIEADGLCSCGKVVCTPGKHPKLQTWTRYEQEQATEQQVRQWWSQWPRANVAIVCGAVSGIVVVDIDPRNGGNESKSEFAFPPTVTCLTGGGGEHYYYAHPGGVFNRKLLAAGIDLKGDGGYVIAPPSNHQLGLYRWEVGFSPWESPLAPFPEFINRDDPVREATRHPDFAAALERALQGGIPVGNRNVFLTQAAAFYFARGGSYEDTLQRIVGLNGMASHLDDRGTIPDLKEITVLVKSIYTLPQTQRERPAANDAQAGGRQQRLARHRPYRRA